MAFLLTKPKFPFFPANSLAGAVLERQRQALQIQKLSSSIQKVLGGCLELRKYVELELGLDPDSITGD